MLPSERIIHERGLLHAVLAGDESAWRLWYDQAYGDLHRYASWRCGGLRDLVEDVVQETWLTAIRGLRTFDPEQGSFVGWLQGIAANVVRNQLRRQAFRKSRQQPLGDVPAGDGDVSALEERAKRVAQALDSLSERHEKVLRAKYLEQQSVAEIAEHWQESVKAIESLLGRARQSFRDAYEGQATQEQHDAPTT